MSIIPDWMKNAGDAINDSIDDGLDLFKDNLKLSLNNAKKIQNIIQDNTWDIVSRPVNTAIDFATLPTRAKLEGATIVDDYFFENEKREIKQKQADFIDNEAERVIKEEKSIEDLQKEAEKHAEQELEKMKEYQKKEEPLLVSGGLNQTLKESSQPVKDVVSNAKDDMTVITQKTRIA